MNYQTVIGLEIHAELCTDTKIFCGCANDFGSEENSLCCPTCTGLPGALPVLNRRAVEYTIAAGLVLGCEIAKSTKWDRKNYFYPDSPKAYQISQLYAPLCIGGGLDINGRFIRLNRIHLEEDAGKLIHRGASSYIDFNRTGVPLIEIVTEPDITSADEAVTFAEQVRQTLVYAGVCDGKMERGSMRVDANVSIMPEGSNVLGTRTEIKNINSFKFIRSAIEYEVARQTALLESGGRVVQETRRYSDETGETSSMRSKEDSHDYRYFPDPDILPLTVSDEDIETIGAALKEPPRKRYARYVGEFSLAPIDAETILGNMPAADLFDEVVALGVAPKTAANVMKSEILRCINLAAEELTVLPVTARDVAALIGLADSAAISGGGLKQAVQYMFETGKSAEAAVRELNLTISEDVELVRGVIAEVAAENPNAVAQYAGGDAKVLSFFMGQCNKRLKGQAHPKTIQKELTEYLNRIR
jgi:aspartyl-tRNA(Asn)/glutamyl-tRNA(Gln) amidotransferase subunit B